EYSFVIADIPGLIEGAHAGVGLGHEFLRHVERTKVLIHVIDGTSVDPLEDFQKVNAEIALYNPDLPKRPQVIALNKIDVTEVRERLDEVTVRLRQTGLEIFPIAAATGEGIPELMGKVASMLQ